MVFHKCRLRAVSRNKTCMYLNGTILHPAYKIHTRLELFQKANGYKPWLVNTTVDVCRFVRKPFNPVAIAIAKLFIEFSNFNHTCPYLVCIYKWRNWKLAHFLQIGSTNRRWILSQIYIPAAWYSNWRISFELNLAFWLEASVYYKHLF